MHHVSPYSYKCSFGQIRWRNNFRYHSDSDNRFSEDPAARSDAPWPSDTWIFRWDPTMSCSSQQLSAKNFSLVRRHNDNEVWSWSVYEQLMTVWITRTFPWCMRNKRSLPMWRQLQNGYWGPVDPAKQRSLSSKLYRTIETKNPLMESRSFGNTLATMEGYGWICRCGL